jgi:hypothetical protein
LVVSLAGLSTNDYRLFVFFPLDPERGWPDHADLPVASLVRSRLATSTCAVFLAGLAGLTADTRTNLRLIVDAAHVLSTATRTNAIAEASRIWSRYDVSLLTDDDGRCAPESPAAITVTIDASHESSSGDAGLGAIGFAADGLPDSSIVLRLDAVARIATSAPFMGVHPALWPSGLRDEIIARALGRALAHEIGHYLLRSPHHANAGLMRARQKGSALGSPSDRPFALTPPDRARLRLTLAEPIQSICPVIATR